MSLQKLQKRALRELKASPQKAAMLALLAVVAAWFWAPLVFKSRSNAAPTPVAAAPTAVPSASPAPIASTPGNPSTAPKPRHPWQEVAARIERDPHMQPATLTVLAKERNPFAPLAAIAAIEMPASALDAKKQAGEDSEEEAVPARPDDLGLVLSSTLVGRKRRAALISGRTYELGSKISVEGEAFRLVEVEPSRIVLERDGQQYTLSIKRRTGGGRIELRSAAP
jgi:hypothetical protein